MQGKSLISVTELKRLLHELRERRPDISIRFRLLGEMWNRNFMSIAFLNGKGVLLKDDHEAKLIAIHDLSNVMQFELDGTFSSFQAFFHYEVKPMAEFDFKPANS